MPWLNPQRRLGSTPVFMLMRRTTFDGTGTRPDCKTLVAVAIAAICSACPPMPVAQAEGTSAAQSAATPAKPAGEEKIQPPIVIPATIEAFFVTDLYAKDFGLHLAGQQ